jgi:Dockerin type I domain
MNAKRIKTLAALASAAALSPCAAGTLDLAWTEIGSPDLGGYRLHIGTSSNRYDRSVDVHDAHAQVSGLEDGRMYYVRVEAVSKRDKGGSETLATSSEVVTLPRSEITAVGPLMPAGAAGTYSTIVQGTNLRADGIVRIGRPSLRVLAVEPLPDGSLRLLLMHAPRPGEVGLPTLRLGDVVVMNPARRAPEYFARHPIGCDVDGDGEVTPADLAAIEQRQGSRAGQRGFDSAADLSGDGIVDGQDMAILGSRLGVR